MLNYISVLILLGTWSGPKVWNVILFFDWVLPTLKTFDLSLKLPFYLLWKVSGGRWWWWWVVYDYSISLSPNLWITTFDLDLDLDLGLTIDSLYIFKPHFLFRSYFLLYIYVSLSRRLHTTIEFIKNVN